MLSGLLNRYSTHHLLVHSLYAQDGGGPADAATGRAVAALLARLSRLQMAPLEEALSTNVKARHAGLYCIRNTST